MPMWLCAERCAVCEGNCALCDHHDQPIGMYIDYGEEKPERAVNGPCENSDELLSVMQHYFFFDDQGHTHLKD